MIVETDKLIKDYFNTIKEKYPDLTLEELTIIVKAPFSFMRKCMKQVNLPTIRFQYLGIFTVYNGSLTNFNPTDLLKRKGTRVQEKFDKFTAMLNYRQTNQNAHDKQSND